MPISAGIPAPDFTLYEVWGRKQFMGREYDGVFRTTFLIDAQGQIVKVFEDVKPGEHSAEVLAALGQAGA